MSQLSDSVDDCCSLTLRLQHCRNVSFTYAFFFLTRHRVICVGVCLSKPTDAFCLYCDCIADRWCSVGVCVCVSSSFCGVFVSVRALPVCVPAILTGREQRWQFITQSGRESVGTCSSAGFVYSSGPSVTRTAASC